MRENPDSESEAIDRRSTAETHDPRRPIELQSVVVRYENRPDRCTVTPREPASRERTTAWFSADLDTFVDLEEVR